MHDLVRELEVNTSKRGFQCCNLCMRICYDTHGDQGQSKAEESLTAPSFMKVITNTDLRRSKFLRIPLMFMEEHGYKIGELVTLKGPTGFECNAPLAYEKGFGFRRSFALFVEYHEVVVGDTLVFTLVADSNFRVKLYNKFGCERTLFLGISNSTNTKTNIQMKGKGKNNNRLLVESNHEDEDCSYKEKLRKSCNSIVASKSRETICEEVNDASDMPGIDSNEGEVGIDKRWKRQWKDVFTPTNIEENCANEALSIQLVTSNNNKRSGQGRGDQRIGELLKNLSTQANIKHQVVDVEGFLPTAAQFFAGIKHQPSLERNLVVDESAFDASNDKEPRMTILETTKKSFISRHKNLQSNRALHGVWAIANTLELKNPHAAVLMHMSHVQGRFIVCLPSTLSLPQITTEVTIVDTDGNQYPVTWFVSKSRKRLQTGWKDFAIDHKLVVGDVCVFEVVDPNQLILMVHIFKIKNAKEHASNVQLQRSPKVTNVSKNEVIGQQGGKSGPMSVGGTFHYSDKVMQEMHKVKAEIPKILVVLEESSVYQPFQLRFTNTFARLKMPHKIVKATLYDNHGHKWHVTWVGTPKYACCLEGLESFSRDQQLKVGDHCVFELTSKDPVKFKVHITQKFENLDVADFTKLDQFERCLQDGGLEKHKIVSDGSYQDFGMDDINAKCHSQINILKRTRRHQRFKSQRTRAIYVAIRNKQMRLFQNNCNFSKEVPTKDMTFPLKDVKSEWSLESNIVPLVANVIEQYFPSLDLNRLLTLVPPSASFDDTNGVQVREQPLKTFEDLTTSHYVPATLNNMNYTIETTYHWNEVDNLDLNNTFDSLKTPKVEDMVEI